MSHHCVCMPPSTFEGASHTHTPTLTPHTHIFVHHFFKAKNNSGFH